MIYFIITKQGKKAIGHLVDGDVILCGGCVFDYLTIQWDNINLNLHDLELKFPSTHPVSLTSKFFLRTLFRNSITLFKIITYNSHVMDII